MDLQNILESATGSDIFSYLLMAVAGAMTLVFVVTFASLIYHWHYYGIGFFRRWVLITVFGGVGLALVISAYGLMFKIM
jgi:hypothetical protein